MSDYRVKKSALRGRGVVPSSKSHTLRAILFGSLGKGRSVIHQPLFAADTTRMIAACRLFGATVHPFADRIEIEGVNGTITSTEDVIDAGNSGLVLRFCSAIGALGMHPVVITGDASIRHRRPMQPLLSGLSQLNVSALSMRGDGYAPVIIQGPMRSGKALIEGADSQPVSALLIAAAFAEGPTEWEVDQPGEIPWVALTLDWLTRLGIPHEHQGFCRYYLPGGARYEGFEYEVPGDFSSAAFPLVAALVTGSELTLCNLDFEDSQGDKALITLLQQMGGVLEVDARHKEVRVRRAKRLQGMEIDVNPLIDALPILAVLACFAEGETHLRNAAVARRKECDRIGCMAKELRKMGADIEESGEGLRIRSSPLKGTSVDSHDDHRVAMALAVAGFGAEGETHIRSVDCVAKTFPSFRNDLQALGAFLEER